MDISLTIQTPLWRLTDQLLEIREGEQREAEAQLAQLYEAEWKDLGFQVIRRLGDNQDTWHMRVDRWAGVVRLPERDGHAPQLKINPKIEGVDLFFLADYAFGSEGRDRASRLRLQALLDSVREEPAAQLLAWFLAELDTFIHRHLRRDYVIQREVFEGRIRGRLLLSDYLQRHVASGQSHQAPCQFFDFTRDNLANQILKRTLRELRRLAALMPLPKAERQLTEYADRLLPFLGAVSDQQIHSADFNRLRLRASMRHYTPIIEKCRALLGATYMTTDLGKHVQDAFLWNIPILYERALGGILRTTPGVKLSPRRGKATIENSEGQPLRVSPVRPDFFLETANGRVVLDAKYKDPGLMPEAEDEVIEIEIPGGKPIRIRRSDAYQAVAYGQHEKYRPAIIGLIYPIVLAENQVLPGPYRITGFNDDVLLLFLDVGEHATHNVDNFRSILLEGMATAASRKDLPAPLTQGGGAAYSPPNSGSAQPRQNTTASSSSVR